MYPYHNQIKKRINNKELVSYEYVDKYKNITPCLLLHFITEPKIRPIREHRFKEYETIFKNKGLEIPFIEPPLGSRCPFWRLSYINVQRVY